MIQVSHQPFVQTVYYGPTNTRQARVKATNLSSGKSLYYTWNSGLSVLENHVAAAEPIFQIAESMVGAKMPVKLLACGSKDSRGYIFTAAL